MIYTGPSISIIVTSVLICSVTLLSAQSYTSWLSGSADDVGTSHQFGIVLAGGGGDNDEAMQWMLERAQGGDVVVLRASGSDGYNDYFFSELGVPVNSVETIRFDDASAAQDSTVVQKIRNAEVLFLAGGDQYDYELYWKDSPVETAINYLLNEKQATVGGTSAGMAVLGQYYYTPTSFGVTSEEALANPFHPYLESGLSTDTNFIQAPFLQRTLTDTHWADRDREGRTVTFLARLAAESGERAYAITANEYTAVAIDASGTARVFGETPQYPDYAHFMAVNCQDEILPELLQPDQPLAWVRGQAAVKVYRVPGTPTAEHSFDLTAWNDGTGGEWLNWYVDNGELLEAATATSDCAEVLTTVTEVGDVSVRIGPNPTRDRIGIDAGRTTLTWEIFGNHGQRVARGSGSARVDLRSFGTGVYTITLHTLRGAGNVRVVVL